jgi:GT2 family glycosyltransferase
MQGMLSACLNSLQTALANVSRASSYHITLVDNASEFPYEEVPYEGLVTRVLRLDSHTSFAKACNIGVSGFESDFILLLNNDVFLHPNAITSMLECFEESGIGVVGTRLVFPDGSIQHCGVVFGPDKVGPYHVCRMQSPEASPSVVTEYQAVTGACMLIETKLYSSLGGLSEDYSFGLEDIEFCLRARKKGFRILCDNRFASLHMESMTPGRSELDRPSRALFMERWAGKYSLDG